MKQCFLHVWHGIDQTIVNNAIDEWRGRLRASMPAKGVHFEQLLWQYSAIWQETFQFLSYVTRLTRWFFLEITTNSNFQLSQGNAAIYWRCGGKYYMGFVEIYFSVKQLKKWKSFKNWQRHRHEFGVLFFGDTVYIAILTCASFQFMLRYEQKS